MNIVIGLSGQYMSILEASIATATVLQLAMMHTYVLAFLQCTFSCVVPRPFVPILDDTSLLDSSMN